MIEDLEALGIRSVEDLKLVYANEEATKDVKNRLKYLDGLKFLDTRAKFKK